MIAKVGPMLLTGRVILPDRLLRWMHEGASA